MMDAPIAAVLDRDTLVALIAAEGMDVDLAGAVQHNGWQNSVIETRDGWIFRFPRKEAHSFAREIDVLSAVRGRLSAETPHVAWTGVRSRFAAYPTLTGQPIDLNRYAVASPAIRGEVAGSLADFLATMHGALSDRQIGSLGIPGLGSVHLVDEFQKRLRQVPDSARPEVDALRDAFVGRWVDQGVHPSDVVLHNDFHVGNMTFTAPLGRLKAVWDFSGVELGDASYDLRYLFESSVDLTHRVAQRYERLTGIRLDLEGAAVAGHFEAVSDALVEGRDVREVLHRWDRLRARN
jgi:aminoglycoside phosphotransferase (APT) family kinase protein